MWSTDDGKVIVLSLPHTFGTNTPTPKSLELGRPRQDPIQEPQLEVHATACLTRTGLAR